MVKFASAVNRKPMESKIYKVEGMPCAGCAISVETILKKQESDLGAITELLTISKQTVRTIKQNLL